MALYGRKMVCCTLVASGLLSCGVRIRYGGSQLGMLPGSTDDPNTAERDYSASPPAKRRKLMTESESSSPGPTHEADLWQKMSRGVNEMEALLANDTADSQTTTREGIAKALSNMKALIPSSYRELPALLDEIHGVFRRIQALHGDVFLGNDHITSPLQSSRYFRHDVGANRLENLKRNFPSQPKQFEQFLDFQDWASKPSNQSRIFIIDLCSLKNKQLVAQAIKTIGKGIDFFLEESWDEIVGAPYNMQHDISLSAELMRLLGGRGRGKAEKAEQQHYFLSRMTTMGIPMNARLALQILSCNSQYNITDTDTLPLILASIAQEPSGITLRHVVKMLLQSARVQSAKKMANLLCHCLDTAFQLTENIYPPQQCDLCEDFHGKHNPYTKQLCENDWCWTDFVNDADWDKVSYTPGYRFSMKKFHSGAFCPFKDLGIGTISKGTKASLGFLEGLISYIAYTMLQKQEEMSSRVFNYHLDRMRTLWKHLVPKLNQIAMRSACNVKQALHDSLAQQYNFPDDLVHLVHQYDFSAHNTIQEAPWRERDAFIEGLSQGKLIYSCELENKRWDITIPVRKNSYEPLLQRLVVDYPNWEKKEPSHVTSSVSTRVTLNSFTHKGSSVRCSKNHVTGKEPAIQQRVASNDPATMPGDHISAQPPQHSSGRPLQHPATTVINQYRSGDRYTPQGGDVKEDPYIPQRMSTMQEASPAPTQYQWHRNTAYQAPPVAMSMSVYPPMPRGLHTTHPYMHNLSNNGIPRYIQGQGIAYYPHPPQQGATFCPLRHRPSNPSLHTKKEHMPGYRSDELYPGLGTGTQPRNHYFNSHDTVKFKCTLHQPSQNLSAFSPGYQSYEKQGHQGSFLSPTCMNSGGLPYDYSKLESVAERNTPSGDHASSTSSYNTTVLDHTVDWLLQATPESSQNSDHGSSHLSVFMNNEKMPSNYSSFKSTTGQNMLSSNSYGHASNYDAAMLGATMDEPLQMPNSNDYQGFSTQAYRGPVHPPTSMGNEKVPSNRFGFELNTSQSVPSSNHSSNSYSTTMLESYAVGQPLQALSVPNPNNYQGSAAQRQDANKSTSHSA